MYRSLALLLLLSPPAVLAAEPLGSDSLSGSYVRDAAPCPPTGSEKKDRNHPGCSPTGTDTPVAEQAVHDAEQQSSTIRLNPAATSPDTLLPPATLPEPPVTPLQQEIIHDFESLQRPAGGQ
jgi:hypothetical protein